jgi:ribonuclease P protein component
VSQDFPRRARLLKASEYRRVFENPDAKAGQAEILLLAIRNDLGEHRLGLAVAKKHLPSAVQRNRLKRIARERFRQLPTPQNGLDIVLLSRPAANQADRVQLARSIDAQLQRLLRRCAP